MTAGVKKETSAISLRNGLISIVFLIFAIGGAGFYFARGWVTDYAQQVADTIAEAESSKQTASSLSNLKIALLQQQDIVNLAGNLYASASNWETQAIKDLNAYAAASGLKISSYSTDTNEPDSDAPMPSPGPALSNSVRPLTIELDTPVSYAGLLKFLTYIHDNVPKMRVTNLELGRSADGAAEVVVSNLIIGVYTR